MLSCYLAKIIYYFFIYTFKWFYIQQPLVGSIRGFFLVARPCTNFVLVRYMCMYVHDCKQICRHTSSHIKKCRLIKQEFFSGCVTLNAVIFVSDVT